MKSKIIYFLFASALFFSACNSTKKINYHSKKQTRVDSVYKLMHQNQVKMNWLSGKFKGVYQMPDKQQVFNGQIRMRKDSIIWVSIYAVMNIEIFRLEVKRDSFLFVNKLEKTYMSESNQYLKDRTGIDIDFDMLQALVLGNDFPYYQTNVFKLYMVNGNYQLSTVSRRKLKSNLSQEKTKALRILMQNILVDKNNYRILKQTVKVVGQDKAKLRMQYNDYTDIDGQLFAKQWVLRLKEDKKSYVEINFSKVVFDKPQKFPFHISRKYKRIKP